MNAALSLHRSRTRSPQERHSHAESGVAEVARRRALAVLGEIRLVVLSRSRGAAPRAPARCGPQSWRVRGRPLVLKTSALEGSRPSSRSEDVRSGGRQVFGPGRGRVCEVETPADFVAKRRSRGLSGPHLAGARGAAPLEPDQSGPLQNEKTASTRPERTSSAGRKLEHEAAVQEHHRDDGEKPSRGVRRLGPAGTVEGERCIHHCDKITVSPFTVKVVRQRLVSRFGKPTKSAQKSPRVAPDSAAPRGGFRHEATLARLS